MSELLEDTAANHSKHNIKQTLNKQQQKVNCRSFLPSLGTIMSDILYGQVASFYQCEKEKFHISMVR